jgi:uncharacterized protein (TIGR02001 family)
MRPRQANIGESLTISGMPATTLRRAVLILTVLHGMAAHAQTSGSVTLVSDYRFRGMSLSNGHPALQLNLEYDSARDWYAGVFASPVILRDEARRPQLIAYAGYAHRLMEGISWEAGAVRAQFAGLADYNYTEFYTGLSSDNASGRIYASPDYYHQGYRSIYAEFNGTYPIRPWLQLIGHAGYLCVSGGDPARSFSMANRWDARVGIGMRADDWNVQLALATAQRQRQSATANGYPAGYTGPYAGAYGSSDPVEAGSADNPRTVILSVSRSF